MGVPGASPAHAAFPGEPGVIVSSYTIGPVAVPEQTPAYLFTVDPSGSGAQGTLEGSADEELQPSYSPDGSRIAYVGRPAPDSDERSIGVMNSDGSGSRMLVGSAPGAGWPEFKAGGESVLYECTGAAGSSDICSVGVGGGGPISLITTPADEHDPVTGRDGRLFFTRGVGAAAEVWVREPGGAERQLTSNGLGESAPDVSPDGKTIAVSREAVGIVLMSSQGGSERILTRLGDWPNFSPDGAEVAYLSYVGPPGPSIHVVGANGSGDRMVWATGFFEVSLLGLDWQPRPVACGGSTATQVGTAGPDKLIGTPGPDVIASLGGSDTVKGLRGRDVICAGDGRDRIFGGKGKGKDRCYGQQGRDIARGCERPRKLFLAEQKRKAKRKGRKSR